MATEKSSSHYIRFAWIGDDDIMHITHIAQASKAPETWIVPKKSDVSIKMKRERNKIQDKKRQMH